VFQEGNRNAEAFVFLNHYLDLTDAIADGQNDMIDDTDLQGTDFPTNVPLPQTMHVENEQHEQVREWILTNAMDRDVSQVNDKKLILRNILNYFSARVRSTNYSVWVVSWGVCMIILRYYNILFDNFRAGIYNQYVQMY